MSFTTASNRRPDQQVVHYLIEVTESFYQEQAAGLPAQSPSCDASLQMSKLDSKILQVTTRCFLTYTFSSLKQAIATQNPQAVQGAIGPGAWLYGVEENGRFYENRQERFFQSSKQCACVSGHF